MKTIMKRMHVDPSHFFQSVFTKVLAVILILILPLNIFTIMLSNMALNNIIEQTQLSVSNVMQNYLTDAEERMQHQASVFYTMQNRDANGIIVCRQEGGIKYEKARQQFFDTVWASLALTQAADGAFMYMQWMDDILVWNIDSHIHPTEYIKDYINELSEENLPKGWYLVTLLGKDGQEHPMLWCFSELQGIYSGCWIELENVAEKLKKDLQYENVRVVFSEKEMVSAHKDKMIVSMYFQRADMYMAVELDNREINGSILTIYLIMKRVAVVALILLPVLYYFLYRLLLQPLKRIKQAHAEIESGNLEFRISTRAGSVEFKQVYASFNHMVDNIKNLKIDNYEKELEKQNMELKNLQLQIRPHFLLNTFNLIYTLAEDGETEYMQEIMLYLSDYFRYIFRSGKDLEMFGKEQKLIEGYINMARIRYPDSIEITYCYAPEISFVRVPPLLLHNFIENIVKHVVQTGIVTHISIEGTYGRGKVFFRITDDGPGIEEERKKQIEHRMYGGAMAGEGIGMANAYRRLKFFYGEEADIRIETELGKGTSILIEFPYNLDNV